MLADLRRPSALTAVATLLLALACSAPREHRRGIERIEEQWDDDVVAEDALEDLVAHVRALGRSGAREPTALASVVSLSRVAAGNPSYFARAEALDAAWKLAARLPAEPFREDDVDRAAFSAQTRRYEELMADPDARDGAELLGIVDAMAQTRFPVGQVQLAVDLADLVVSQALWGEGDALRAAFAEHAPGAARHALTVITLRAARLELPGNTGADELLRQQALAAARHLPVDLGLAMVADSFVRDPEELVALAAMDSLAALAERAPADDVRAILELARRRGDRAVDARAEALEAALAS